MKIEKLKCKRFKQQIFTSGSWKWLSDSTATRPKWKPNYRTFKCDYITRIVIEPSDFEDLMKADKIAFKKRWGQEQGRHEFLNSKQEAAFISEVLGNVEYSLASHWDFHRDAKERSEHSTLYKNGNIITYAIQDAELLEPNKKDKEAIAKYEKEQADIKICNAFMRDVINEQLEEIGMKLTDPIGTHQTGMEIVFVNDVKFFQAVKQMICDAIQTKLKDTGLIVNPNKRLRSIKSGKIFATIDASSIHSATENEEE